MLIVRCTCVIAALFGLASLVRWIMHTICLSRPTRLSTVHVLHASVSYGLSECLNLDIACSLPTRPSRCQMDLCRDTIALNMPGLTGTKQLTPGVSILSKSFLCSEQALTVFLLSFLLPILVILPSCLHIVHRHCTVRAFVDLSTVFIGRVASTAPAYPALRPHPPSCCRANHAVMPAVRVASFFLPSTRIWIDGLLDN